VTAATPDLPPTSAAEVWEDVTRTAGVSRPVAVIIGLAVLIPLAVFGVVDVAHCLLLAALTITALELIPAAQSPDQLSLPPPPSPNRAGGRADISDLAWAALRGDGRMSDHVMRRVRTLAARRHTDVPFPVNQPPTPAQLNRWLDQLEQRDPEEAP
jgi:hypothetical protein